MEASQKCTRDCRTCSLVSSCFNKRALLKPVPRHLWFLFGVGVSLPIATALLPSLSDYYMGNGSILGETSEERKKHYDEILKKVGIQTPENVRIVETTNLGPTSIGSSLGGTIYVPRLLLDLSEEKLSDVERKALLEEEGTLIPTQQEMDFIMGHEGAHLAQNHSLQTASGVVAGISLAHILLKLSNGALNFLGKKPLTTLNTLQAQKVSIKHTFTTLLLSGAYLFYHSWKIEKDADIRSARSLHLEHQAKELAEKKRIQNLTWKRLTGDIWITPSGNDLTSLEHPPVTIQVNYLSALDKL